MRASFLPTLIATLSLFSSGILFADVQGSTDNNTSVAIPDADINGVPISASTITITQNEIIEEATFTIEGLSHTYVGDLVAVVRHVETDTTATLFSRIGKDNPNIGDGDESNFEGDYDFSDATNNMLWDEAERGSTDYVLRNKAGDPLDVQPNPGIYRAAAGTTGAPISLNATFAGLSTAGTWRLELSDRNATEVGSFREFGVSFVSAIPEPHSAAILLVSALFPVSFRRRRN